MILLTYKCLNCVWKFQFSDSLMRLPDQLFYIVLSARSSESFSIVTLLQDPNPKTVIVRLKFSTSFNLKTVLHIQNFDNIQNKNCWYIIVWWNNRWTTKIIIRSGFHTVLPTAEEKSRKILGWERAKNRAE